MSKNRFLFPLLFGVLLCLLLTGCGKKAVTPVRETDDPTVMDEYNEDGTPRVLGKYSPAPTGKGYLLAYYTVYEYDDAGRQSQVTEYAPDGDVNNVTTCEYDGNGLLLSEVTQDADGDLLYRYDYTYNAAGEPVTAVRTPPEEQE